jgi:class 3 adenylate cyclase
VEAVIALGLDMLNIIEKFNYSNETKVGMRIGVHTGPVIGKKLLFYCLISSWRDSYEESVV